MPLDFTNLLKRLQKAKQEKEGKNRQTEDLVEAIEQAHLRGSYQQPEPKKPEPEEEPEETQRAGLRPEGGYEDWLEGEEEESTIEQKKDINRRYPLIPADPEPGEKVFAEAHITYDPDHADLIYRMIEPQLTDENRRILNRIEDILKERIDVDFGQLKRKEAKDYLQEQVRQIIRRNNFGLSQEEQDILEYYAFRNFVGLGQIEPLMNDTNIEDISCDGIGVPLYVYHRDPVVGSVRTNVSFDEEDRLDSFVRKLAQRCGRSISTASPLLDGSLPDGSRVQATLGTDIARRGTNFTIRRFTEEPLTPIHLMEYGSINAEMLAYLWVCVENGKSILVSGATAAGKTTLLNALSLFISPELKIVSIEDTPELRLPHPNWVPEVAREGFGFGEHETGRVTLDDLLKESLRQRPDYIIVGEVRGAEAYILFQQIATGHPGMSTIHASNMEKIMDRLTTSPMNLSPSLIENLDLIVFAKRTRRKGSYVRRVGSIYEFEGYDRQRDEPLTNLVFKWRASDDEFLNTGDSSLLAEISREHGVSIRDLQEEIVRRRDILLWMHNNGIKHYQQVGNIFSTYYHQPQKIMDTVEAEL